MTGTVEFFECVDGETKKGEAQWAFFAPGKAYEDGGAKEKAFECRIAIVAEPEGFSAHAMNLPGAISQGDTMAEALENVTEACRGVLREYIDMGRIPWSDVEIDGQIVAERRILVNV
jgi:predicted RNase H-like HicB family nuclease